MRTIILLLFLGTVPGVFASDGETCNRCDKYLDELSELQHKKPELQKLLQKNLDIAGKPEYKDANIKIQSNRLMIVRKIQELQLRDNSLRSYLQSDECQKCPNVKGKVQ